MNIGIICYPTFGGSGIIASELGKGLSIKHKVHFISYKKPVRLNTEDSNIYYHEVNVPNYPLFEYPPYELALAAKIVEVVKMYNLNILHVHYAIPHAYAAVSAQQILLDQNIKIPIVTTLHGTDITLVGKTPFLLSSVNYAINKSSLVTCVSKDLKRETIKNFNIQHNIKVIPNFINFSESIIVKKNPSSKKKLAHISNFRPVKRVLDVILVFQKIQQDIDAELIMIGDGPDLKKAKALVQELGLVHCIHFIGTSNDIDTVLHKSDLFLLPSESESFGLVALEAMSYSIPVITTNSGGIIELVVDGESGFTCNVGDIDDMSQKCIDLLSNPKLYFKMSAAAHETAKKYDSKKIIPLYEACYLSVLQ